MQGKRNTEFHIRATPGAKPFPLAGEGILKFILPLNNEIHSLGKDRMRKRREIGRTLQALGGGPDRNGVGLDWPFPRKAVKRD